MLHLIAHVWHERSVKKRKKRFQDPRAYAQQIKLTRRKEAMRQMGPWNAMLSMSKLEFCILGLLVSLICIPGILAFPATFLFLPAYLVFLICYVRAFFWR